MAGAGQYLECSLIFREEVYMKKLLVLAFLLAMGSISFAAEPVITSGAVKDIPTDPMDPAWGGAGAAIIPMAPQNVAAPGINAASVPSIKVSSVHNDKNIAIRVEWYDSTVNDAVNMSDKFSDACAIQFAVKPGTEPNFMMGEKDGPVQILQWKAAWEKDLAKGYQDVEQAYPNYNVDTYPETKAVPQKANYPVTSFSPNAQKYIAGLAAGNNLSNPLKNTTVEELNAEGFGTLTAQATQNAMGKGVSDYRYWKVVIVRPLDSGDASDAVLKAGSTVPVAFTVWDGSKGERGARKNYSDGGWVKLNIQ
jgi:DMSO reductase family type II enzyme heme b subunit